MNNFDDGIGRKNAVDPFRASIWCRWWNEHETKKEMKRNYKYLRFEHYKHVALGRSIFVDFVVDEIPLSCLRFRRTRCAVSKLQNSTIRIEIDGATVWLAWETIPGPIAVPMNVLKRTRIERMLWRPCHNLPTDEFLDSIYGPQPQLRGETRWNGYFFHF